MVMLATGTWVVVADAEKAVILENSGDTQAPRLRTLRRETASAPPDEATDRPGRMPDPAPGQRSAMEMPDYPRLAGERFAAELAGALSRFAQRGLFDRLILAAPPQVLGALRDQMDAGLRAKVVAELPKTLTNHSPEKITQVIAAEIAAA